MDEAPLRAHQDATMAELGEALARLRDELAWTTQRLREAETERAVAEDRAAGLQRRLDAVHDSATWRVGRTIIGPFGRLRRRSGS